MSGRLKLNHEARGIFAMHLMHVAELILLRHMAYEDPKFRPLWDTGISAYLAGDWPTAHHIFNDCLELTDNKCGPCKFLLKEINDNGGIAPDDWDGYRVDF